MICLELFWGFLKIGAFSFGGAYAAIPLVRDVVLSYGWMGEEMIAYMIAVSESTPGPIMVNLATYVGSSKAGLFGAFLATAAVVLPAFFIIILLTALLKNVIGNKYVQAALGGLKACITGVILATGFYMTARNCLGGGAAPAPDAKCILVCAALFLIYYGSRTLQRKGLLKKKMSPILLIVAAACLGIAVFRT